MNIVYPPCSCCCMGSCQCAKRRRLEEIQRQIQALECEKRALEMQMYPWRPAHPWMWPPGALPVQPLPNIQGIHVDDVLKKVK